MAILTFTNGFFTVNGVDLADHVKTVELTTEVDLQDDNAMGDDTKSNYPGLKNWRLAITALQDFAAGEVDATIFPLLGNTAGFTVEVRAVNTARSATNPGYNATAILARYNPIAGQIGQLLQTPIEFVPGGSAPTLLRSTA